MPPNLSGYYRFVSQDNMENYLRALDINVTLRKLVCLLKPDKEIIHTDDHMTIRTLTSLRNYVMDFDLGVEFEEDLGPVDGRKCQTTVYWDGDQLVCEQKGEKQNRGWRHWLEGDQLHLVRRSKQFSHFYPHFQKHRMGLLPHSQLKKTKKSANFCVLSQGGNGLLTKTSFPRVQKFSWLSKGATHCSHSMTTASGAPGKERKSKQSIPYA
uniref:Retinol binding protein 5 n=1 Tax=Laticauda laticaudata TaxID=8630 RepID=A0A8C5SK31_LATLA